MKISKHLIYSLILFISINAFSQSESTPQLKLSNDFVRNVKFETNLSSIYLTDVKIAQLDTGHKFLLDNGCRESFISESLAVKLNFKTIGKRTITDIFGKQEKLSFGRLDFIISGILFKNIKTYVIPDESFKTDCDVRGIIGLNLIKKCVWSISLKNGIFISSNLSSLPVEEYTKQKLYFKTEIKCNFLDGKPVLANLDLGMNTFVELNPKYFRKNIIGDARVKNVVTNQAFEGALFSYKNDNTHKTVVKSALAMVDGFSLLGDSTIKNAIINIDTSDYSLLTIGSKILDYYDIILNVKKKEFYSRNVKTQFKQLSGYGFAFDVFDSILIVNYIVEKSSADKCGILLNDTIVEINNKQIIEIVNNLRECKLTDVILSELYKNNEALIKISRLGKPIFIRNEYLFENLFEK